MALVKTNKTGKFQDDWKHVSKKIKYLHKLISKIEKSTKKEDISEIVECEEKYNKLIRIENAALLAKQLLENE